MNRFYGPLGVPPGRQHAPGMDHPGFEHARNVAKAAREQPGLWIDLATGMSRQQATQKVSQLRHRPSVAFRPSGTFEVRREGREDGHAVQIRYVGSTS